MSGGRTSQGSATPVSVSWPGCRDRQPARIPASARTVTSGISCFQPAKRVTSRPTVLGPGRVTQPSV